MSSHTLFFVTALAAIAVATACSDDDSNSYSSEGPPPATGGFGAGGPDAGVGGSGAWAGSGGHEAGSGGGAAGVAGAAGQGTGATAGMGGTGGGVSGGGGAGLAIQQASATALEKPSSSTGPTPAMNGEMTPFSFGIPLGMTRDFWAPIGAPMSLPGIMQPCMRRGTINSCTSAFNT